MAEPPDETDWEKDYQPGEPSPKMPGRGRLTTDPPPGLPSPGYQGVEFISTPPDRPTVGGSISDGLPQRRTAHPAPHQPRYLPADDPKPLDTETVLNTSDLSRHGYRTASSGPGTGTNAKEPYSEKTTVASHDPHGDYNAIADRVYIEGWALALTFGAVDQALQHSWGVAAVCAALSAFCQFVVIRWSAWVKSHPNNPVLQSLNTVAIDARWWVATLMVFLVYLALSPYVEQQRWPFLNQFASQLSTDAPLSPERWPALTKVQAAALAESVRTIPPQDITVACETLNCKDLADGIAEILLKTESWHVSIIHHGGLDITGVAGIRLNPNEPESQALKTAIESATHLRVTLGPDTRKTLGGDQPFETYLVVGTRPF